MAPGRATIWLDFAYDRGGPEGTNVTDAYREGESRFTGRIPKVVIDVETEVWFMKRYRFELILGAVFLVLLLAYCYFVSAGPRLTREEVDGFVGQIDKHLQMPEPTRTEFLSRVRAWGYADDGRPVYLAIPTRC